MRDIPFDVYADLLPIPYVRGGRARTGLDCVGLFLEVMRRLGMHIPQYGSDPDILDIALAKWERIPAPEAGCALLVRSHDPRWHIGVAISANRMIHAKQNCGVVVERIDTPLYRSRLEGAYKWRAASAR